jgi:hypothetical protein
LDKGAGFSLKVNWNNYFGHLPAFFYPILLLYKWSTIIYFLVNATWFVLAFIYRKELLRVQTYIGIVLGLAAFECLFKFVNYDFYNINGYISKVILTISVVLSASRNTASLFLLLIVSMGHGVVKPSLGGVIKKVYALTYTHFLIAVVNTIATNVVKSVPDPIRTLL